MTKANPRLMRKIRHRRVRKKVVGIPLRPRLDVFRSLNHIYVQLIDDSQGHTLVAASTLDPEVRDRIVGMSKTEKAKVVGTLLAEKALNNGIKQVVFDRGGYKYHGRIKALAEATRQAGLEL